MSIFNRNLLSALENWKKSVNRKPLVLRGARQTGKTTLINLFSKQYKQFIYLDLDNINDRKIINEESGFDKTLEAIFFLKNADINEKDSLIFFDEIQNSPAAVSFLRYFYEKTPEYSVIAAGSLLETLIDKQISFPVGRVEYMTLRPFSFSEFLNADANRNLIDARNNIIIPEYAHNSILDKFRTYTLIGGMPEVVKNYFEYRNLTEIKKIINNLIASYKDDAEKYTKGLSRRELIRHLLDNIFYHAAERIKFNGFGNTKYRSREVSETFRILEKAMLLKLIYPSTAFNLPCLPDRKKSPRLQILDTGLVNFKCGIEKDVYNSADISDIYRGRIAEHIVGQELLSVNSDPEYNLIFWIKEKSEAEIDFILKYENVLIPVEVKSGKTLRSKSLLRYLDESKGDIAVRINGGIFSVSDEKTEKGLRFKLYNVPYYLVSEIFTIIRSY